MYAIGNIAHAIAYIATPDGFGRVVPADSAAAPAADPAADPAAKRTMEV